MRAKILLGMATLFLAGCGSVINGENQTVDVVVKGSPSAFCNFSTSVYRNSGNFPNKLNLERSREPLQAECHGEQNLYKKFEIKPIAQAEGTVGNVANATTFLGLSVDSLTGGVWAYPDPLVVDFRVVDTAPKAAWPENTADGAAAVIAKPTPVHMQPVEDEQLNPSIGNRASGKPKIIEAVPVVDEGVKPAVKSASAKMKPVVSPEDDPAVQKARAEAKAKAAADAKKKAKAKAAAKKKAEEAAKAKAKAAAEAKEAEQKAEALPEVKEEVPAASPETVAPATATDTNAVVPPTAPVVLPVPDVAKPAENAAPTAPKAQENAVPTTPKPQENAVPAPKAEAGAQPVDADQYLTGDGQ